MREQYRWRDQLMDTVGEGAGSKVMEALPWLSEVIDQPVSEGRPLPPDVAEIMEVIALAGNDETIGELEVCLPRDGRPRQYLRPATRWALGLER
jgi:hypothetical protein